MIDESQKKINALQSDIDKVCNLNLELIRTLEHSMKWIKDAENMMKIPACGWPDASQSLEIATIRIEETLRKLKEESKGN